MNIQTVSIKKLRENFSWVKEELESGRELLLIYRPRPLAEMKPVMSKRASLRSFSKRQLKMWIEEDKLGEKEQRQIETIINRLP